MYICGVPIPSEILHGLYKSKNSFVNQVSLVCLCCRCFYRIVVVQLGGANHQHAKSKLIVSNQGMLVSSLYVPLNVKYDNLPLSHIKTSDYDKSVELSMSCRVAGKVRIWSSLSLCLGWGALPWQPCLPEAEMIALPVVYIVHQRHKRIPMESILLV